MTSAKAFSRFATVVARVTGRPTTFAFCVLLIVIWGVSGPVFHYSDTWQLVINTGTTIITFLQVFLIQNTQNREGAAIQAKLDALIRASAAHNHFIGAEDLTEDELEQMRESDEGGRDERAEEAHRAANDAVAKINKEAAEAARTAKPRIG